VLFSIAGKRVWVAGDRGLVGSAVVRRLDRADCQIVTAPRGELDLRDQAAVRTWMRDNRPQVVVLAAAKVGGILANSEKPAEFLYDNLMIESNIIHAAYETGVEKLLFLGSSCIYPKHAEQPMREDSLLTGPLEPTNEWYAIAKIAGLKLCEAYRKQYGCDFISAMPTNLYGTGDNFDLTGGHVLPALIRKAHEAKVANAPELPVWGSGSPLREFLHVDDLADACLFLIENYSSDQHVNIGTGEEVSIRELAELVKDVVGFRGEVVFDPSRPDGTPRKLQDISRQLALGWRARIHLRDGIEQTYRWYLDNLDTFRR
jgi:GDP-L-fucose synthase